MAKYVKGSLKKALGINVSQASIEDIKNLDLKAINRLSRDQLEKVVKRASMLAVRRREKDLAFIASHENVELPTVYRKWGDQAIKYKMDKTKAKFGDFTSYADIDFAYREGEDLQSLRARLSVLRSFLSSKTSDVERTYKKTAEDFVNKIDILYGTKATDVLKEDKESYWKVFARVMELAGNISISRETEIYQKFSDYVYAEISRYRAVYDEEDETSAAENILKRVILGLPMRQEDAESDVIETKIKGKKVTMSIDDYIQSFTLEEAGNVYRGGRHTPH